MSRCMVCGLDPSTEYGVVFRLNDKGIPGVYACDAHWADAKAKYFPDHDPSAPGPMPPEDDDRPLGPWTGGTHWEPRHD